MGQFHSTTTRKCTMAVLVQGDYLLLIADSLRHQNKYAEAKDVVAVVVGIEILSPGYG